MPKKSLTRAYLETLPFADLIAFAESLGIDVPEHLHRNFLIGEVLEAAAEEAAAEEALPQKDFDAVFTAVDEEETVEDFFDEVSFEEQDDDSVSWAATEISAVLHNPAWAFVFWNISERDMVRATQNGEDFFLRASFPVHITDSDADAFYDIQISPSDTSKYILCPPDKKFLRVELIAVSGKKQWVLNSSKILVLPRSSRLREEMRPGRQEDMSVIMELSGMRELLLDHYKNHRESFL